MLEYLGVSNNGVIVQRFTSKLEEMWKDNGNRISQIYAGTGALQGSKVCVTLSLFLHLILEYFTLKPTCRMIVATRIARVIQALQDYIVLARYTKR